MKLILKLKEKLVNFFLNLVQMQQKVLNLLKKF